MDQIERSTTTYEGLMLAKCKGRNSNHEEVFEEAIDVTILKGLTPEKARLELWIKCPFARQNRTMCGATKEKNVPCPFYVIIPDSIDELLKELKKSKES